MEGQTNLRAAPGRRIVFCLPFFGPGISVHLGHALHPVDSCMWTLNFWAGKWKADLHFLSPLQVPRRERLSPRPLFSLLSQPPPPLHFSLRNERGESITARFPCFSSSTFSRIQIFSPVLFYFHFFEGGGPPNSLRFKMGTCVFMVPPLSWWDALCFFSSSYLFFTSSLRTHAAVCVCVLASEAVEEYIVSV